MSRDASENEEPFLIRFYDPEIKATDARGRDLDSMLEWTDVKLEHCHD
jgi:hypothetical protein